MKQRIHIFGASGSGTTTIASAVCERLGYKHFDTDSFYWYQTQIPFTEARPIDERLHMMNDDLTNHERWILSGSLAGWGNPLVPMFELVVFVYVPQDIRVERLKKREYERYGDDIKPGGSRYDATKEFIEWAGGYDTGLLTGRSLLKHEKWMSELDREVIRITNLTLDDSINAVITAIKGKQTIKQTPKAQHPQRLHILHPVGCGSGWGIV